jgi:enoyl-CoA hydratase/carnithine racemase
VLAGALGLALACDLVLAKESTRFGCPEINVGVFPFMISALIYRNVNRLKANELMMLGELISATEAHKLGLVNRVVPDADFDATVDDWARRLADKSPLLMRLGKDALNATRDMALPEALSALQSQLALALTTEDILEGVTAFREKRAPKWKMR